MNGVHTLADIRGNVHILDVADLAVNLLTYVGVNIFFIIINLTTSPGSLWFYWVTIFWGLAILLHTSKVFILKGKFLGKEWTASVFVMDFDKPDIFSLTRTILD